MSGDQRINLSQAVGIYDAWQKQAADKGEKASLNRLKPEERVAMRKIAEFIKARGLDSDGKIKELTLSGHQISLLDRLGVDLTKVPKENIASWDANEPFSKALDAAGLSVKGITNLGVFEREKFFDKLLEEMQKDPTLSDPRIQELAHSLVMSLRIKCLSRNISDPAAIGKEFKAQFNNRIAKALSKEVTQKTVQSAAKTVATLAPIMTRESKVTKAVSEAEAFAKKDHLLGAFNKIYIGVQLSHPELDEQSPYFLGYLSSALILGKLLIPEGFSPEDAANFTLKPEEKAVLASRGAQDEIAALIEKAKTDPDIDLRGEFEKSINAASSKEWIDKSGLADTGFTAFWFNELSKKILNAVAGPILKAVGRPVVEMEDVRVFGSIQSLNRDVQRAKNTEAKIIKAMNEGKYIDPKFRAWVKDYLVALEGIDRKFTETERRMSQNLRSPYFQGVYAQVLYDHHNFLVQNRDMAEAIKAFSGDGGVASAYLQSSLLQSYSTSSPSVVLENMKKEIVQDMPKDLLNKAKFWAETSAAANSFEGAMVVARMAVEQVRSDATSTRDTLGSLIYKIDSAITTAENRDLSSFGSFGPFLRFFGYTHHKAQARRLNEARQLKIEVCRDAYMKALALSPATEESKKLADYALKEMVKAAKEMDIGRPTPLKQMTKELLATNKMEEQELLGWLFGHDLRNPDVADRSLSALSHLFIVGGVAEAADEMVKVLQEKKESKRPFTDMDVQNMMVIAIAMQDLRPDLRRAVLNMAPSAVKEVLVELRKPEPSLQAVGEGARALRGAAAYLENRQANFGKYNFSIDKDIPKAEEKVAELLKKVPLESQQDAIESRMKTVKEGLNRKTPSFSHEHYDPAVELCRQNPQFGSSRLIELLKLGERGVTNGLPHAKDDLAFARSAFVEVMSKQDRTWTSEELNLLAQIALRGHEKAQELLRENATDYPLANLLIKDPLSALAAAPENKAFNGEFSRKEISLLLSDVVSSMRQDSQFNAMEIKEQRNPLKNAEERAGALEAEMASSDFGKKIGNYKDTPDALLFFFYRAIADNDQTGKKEVTKGALEQYVIDHPDQTDTLAKIAEALKG